jgi:hypothetical protein
MARIRIGRGSIVDLEVDAIVNARTRRSRWRRRRRRDPSGPAGPRLAESAARQAPCPPGEARITNGFDLKAKYVIHTVGPIYDGRGGDAEATLARCYRSSLALADERKIGSVACPRSRPAPSAIPPPRRPPSRSARSRRGSTSTPTRGSSSCRRIRTSRQRRWSLPSRISPSRPHRGLTADRGSAFGGRPVVVPRVGAAHLAGEVVDRDELLGSRVEILQLDLAVSRARRRRSPRSGRGPGGGLQLLPSLRGAARPAAIPAARSSVAIRRRSACAGSAPTTTAIGAADPPRPGRLLRRAPGGPGRARGRTRSRASAAAEQLDEAVVPAAAADRLLLALAPPT